MAHPIDFYRSIRRWSDKPQSRQSSVAELVGTLEAKANSSTPPTPHSVYLYPPTPPQFSRLSICFAIVIVSKFLDYALIM